MGNYMTKLLMHPNENQKESNILHVKQQVATDNSMCTPVSEKKMLCDPRSVSAGISRTPIEQVVAQDNSMCTPILSDKRMLQDPRSISVGIARTPIEAIMQDSSMCTPTLPVKKILCDPRSVSTGISRTPIEVEGTPVSIITKRALPSAIPKYLRKKEYLETNMDVVMPPLSPKKRFVPKLIDSDQGSESDGTQDYLTSNIVKDSKSITPIEKERYAILGLDPRSPAADFDRTPILIPKSLALIKARSQEVLSRRGSYESDIYNPTNSHKNISTSIPKIQMLPDRALETQETLDMEEQNESHVLYTSQQSDSDTSVFEEEDVTVIKNPKCKNEMEKSSIDEQTVVTDEEKNKDNINMKDDCKDIENDMKTIIIKDDTNNIEVWYDSVSSKDITGKKEKENIVEKLLQRKSPREDIIIMFDECATTSTSLKPVKTEERSYCLKNGDIAGRKKKSTNIDATVTLNEKKIFNPEKKIHGAEVLKNRIPFSNRSNNDQVQINSPQHLSRNKIVSTETQQENTPPCKMYNTKSKNGRYWDPNTTVFI